MHTENTTLIPEDSELVDTNSRNSKYRLFSLEKKFLSAKHHSKHQLNSMSKKMFHLQNVNLDQQEKISTIDHEKKQT